MGKGLKREKRYAALDLVSQRVLFFNEKAALNSGAEPVDAVRLDEVGQVEVKDKEVTVNLKSGPARVFEAKTAGEAEDWGSGIPNAQRDAAATLGLDDVAVAGHEAVERRGRVEMRAPGRGGAPRTGRVVPIGEASSARLASLAPQARPRTLTLALARASPRIGPRLASALALYLGLARPRALAPSPAPSLVEPRSSASCSVLST